MKINMFAMTALSFAILTGAHAGEIGESASVKVRIADLDVNTEEGSATTHERLSMAARSVCRNWNPRNFVFSDLKPEVQLYQHCLDKAIVGAVAKINRPAFTSYVNSQMAAQAAANNLRVAMR